MFVCRAVQQRIHDLNQEMEARISVAIEAVEADLRSVSLLHLFVFFSFYQCCGAEIIYFLLRLLFGSTLSLISAPAPALAPAPAPQPELQVFTYQCSGSR